MTCGEVSGRVGAEYSNTDLHKCNNQCLICKVGGPGTQRGGGVGSGDLVWGLEVMEQKKNTLPTGVVPMDDVIVRRDG